MGETEAEGGGAEIFQGAADVQAFAADFSAGGWHGGGAALAEVGDREGAVDAGVEGDCKYHDKKLLLIDFYDLRFRKA